jgi:hypothetical protein
MSCQPAASPVLRGQDGELVFVSVRVNSRLLEELLDALARLEFPINPEIRHGHPYTLVEFPAYDGHITEIQNVLRDAALDGAKLELWHWTAGLTPAALGPSGDLAVRC